MTAHREADSLITSMERGRRRAIRLLQAKGLWPASPEEFGSLEGAMADAMYRVRPAASFRDALQENLVLAAQQRASGLEIEYPKAFREGMILGISAGLLAAVVATLVLLFRSKALRAER